MAPAAADRTWYPYSFLEPLKRNEPHLSSALRLLGRVDETAAVLERLGARITERVYPGMDHTINADEITATRGILDAVLAGSATAS